MILPHPLLPPRFQDLSEDRNMILFLDQDMTLHVRWEGARIHEHHPLTPGAVNRLVKEVLRNMSKYRKDLEIFNRFVRQNAEQPFEDDRPLDPFRFKERELPPAERIAEEENRTIEITAEIEIGISDQLEAERMDLSIPADFGGEAPMGGDFE